MTSFPSRVPQKIRPRVDFNMESYRKLVFAKGVDLTWEQCAECPCYRSTTSFTADFTLTESTPHETGEARPDCELCGGVGYFWHSPQTIRAIVSGGSANTEAFAQYGEYARGMIQVSLLPEHLPAFGDRFTMSDSVSVYRETRIKTASNVEGLRYPIKARTLDLSTGETEARVLRLQYSDANGLSALAQSLTEGVDFVVTGDGKLDFSLGVALGTTPAENIRYSVTYFATPRYYVADHPHTHRDSRTKLKSATESSLLMPIQVQCTREFMGE